MFRMVATGFLEGGPKKILVCDDDRHIARLLQVNFERQGHTVVCCFDGAEAIEILGAADPGFDIAILDVMLPKLNGLEVLKWIRTHASMEHLWVMLMLEDEATRSSLEAMPYRPDAFFSKRTKPWRLFP